MKQVAFYFCSCFVAVAFVGAATKTKQSLMKKRGEEGKPSSNERRGKRGKRETDGESKARKDRRGRPLRIRRKRLVTRKAAPRKSKITGSWTLEFERRSRQKKQAEEQAKTKAAKEAHNQKGHEKNAKASEEARIRAEAASKRRADQDAASMPHDEEEEEDDEAAGSGAGSEEPLAPKKGRLPCCGGAAKTRD